MSFKESKRNQWVLTAGLCFLLLPLGISLWSVLRLEKAVSARRAAFETRGLLDGLSESINSWALLAEKSAPLDGAVTEIEANFASTRKALAKDRKQSSALEAVHREWIAVKNSQTKFNIDKLETIDQKIEELDSREADKLNISEPTIIRGISQIFWLIGMLVILALVMIIYAFLNMKDANLRRVKFMSELKSLQEAAMEASQLKSKFLATVSHEIRTPLNGIIGLSDVLRRSSLIGSEKKLLEVIHQSGKTLLRIINDILDFSKIEAGKLELQVTEFSLQTILSQVVFTLSSKAAVKGIQLSYELDPLIPRKILADSDRLVQVLFNLAGNSIKFSAQGSVIIRVTSVLGSVDPSKLRILFSVQDSGIGMSEEQLRQLFLPFVQLQKVGTSGEAGTGLGLSISQHLIEAMGGKIQVKSELHRGATFSFEIPVEVLPHSKSESESEEDVDPPNEDISVTRLFNPALAPRILVVEDNSTNQLIVQTMLIPMGAEVLLASNGLEALEVMEKTNPDLILMDCQMPIMDGYQATRELRLRGIQVPIIAMTANASQSDKDKCFQEGMNGFVSKPFTIEMLQEELLKFIQPQGREALLTMEVLNILKSKIGTEATQKVLDSFMITLGEFSAMIDEYLSDKNFAELKRLGHRFRGSSAAIGAMEFSLLCHHLENATTDAEVESLSRHLQKISQDLKKNIQAIEKGT